VYPVNVVLNMKKEEDSCLLHPTEKDDDIGLWFELVLDIKTNESNAENK